MKLEHTYKFVATYEDGTVIEMNEDDSSITGQGSSFTDVLNKEKESKLISFVITDGQNIAGVDLQDGHFELNGIPFFQHRPDLTPYKDFRIIYYRTVRQEVRMTNLEPISGKILFYCIGWQVDYNGTNVQKFICI